MAVFNNILAGASGQAGGAGYEIERSLRFDSSSSSYLNRTPSSAGNRKTWTWAGWVKTTATSGTQCLFGTPSGSVEAFDFSTDSFRYYTIGGSGALLKTSAVFRDPSAWLHVILAVDTTQASASNRVKLYVNGSQVTQFSSSTYPAQNYDTYFNNNNAIYIGDRGIGVQGLNAYLADIHFIDGQALAPTDFGEFDDNGVWQPIEYTGTYGTNGFHLDFSDNSSASALGTDTSGNSNSWTVNNISVTAGADNDSLFDSPTNGTQADTGAGGEVSGNYCTLSPLDGWYKVTVSNGNLEATGNSNRYGFRRGTLGSTSGKFYWECVVNGQNAASVGVCEINAPTRDALGDTLIETAYTNFAYGYSSGFQVFIDGSAVYTGSTVNDGDIFGVAVDLDNGKVWFSHNGVFQGSGTQDPASNAGGYSPTNLSSGTPFFQDGAGSQISTGVFNFGQRPFAYSAPSGYKALCTTNLPDPTIADGSTAMDVKTFNANNGNSQSITLEFSPDLVWTKSRSNAYEGQIFDIVRGDNQELVPSSTAASRNLANSLIFDSSGFTMPGANNNANYLTGSSVAWTWDAGTSTVSNTDGSITSSVRANPSAGFSIVSYTGNGTAGATVGHGLNAAPNLFIVKRRDSTSGWRVYQSAIGATKHLRLDTNAAAVTSTVYWNDTEPTSSVFSIGNTTDVNATSATFITYCFAQVEGYSAFGSYTGNGSADGPFVYTGFRPRFLLYKYSSTTGNWAMLDSERNTYNVMDNYLLANTSDAEGSLSVIDFLSNGFKVRTALTSGATLIYAAFAENPFKTARAR